MTATLSLIEPETTPSANQVNRRDLLRMGGAAGAGLGLGGNATSTQAALVIASAKLTHSPL